MLKHKIAIILLASGLQTGCSLVSTVGELPAISHVRDKISDIKLKAERKIPKPDIDRFNSCMLPLTSRIRPGFHALVDHAKSVREDIDADLTAKFAELEDLDLFDDDSILGHIFKHLPKAMTLTEAKAEQPEDKSSSGKETEDEWEKIRARAKDDAKLAFDLSNHYLSAYFKKGAIQIVADELQNDATAAKLLEKVGDLLDREANDPKLAKAAKLLKPQLEKVGKKVERKASGFIGRDGTRYGFPGVIDETARVSIDHTQIGADTIRLIMEALRDTYAPLPVLARSTPAEKAQLADYVIAFDNKGNLKKENDAQGQPRADKYRVDPDHKVRLLWHYDHRDPSKVEAIAITEKRFQSIEAHARKAEAQVAGQIGRAIRGGSWGALNNEALAKLIETAAGVLARHTVERGEWCLLAQHDLLHRN